MIDPLEVTTVRVGQLPSAPLSLTDNIPHEVGDDLKRATIQDLVDFTATYIETVAGVGFRPITVLDGQTLPTTTVKEWILVGKGTFYNVGGGATIVTTEELNALMSNGDFWTLGVEIPINADLIGIVQTIRESYTQTAPSEDAVFKALALKANLDDIPGKIFSIDYPRLLVAQSVFAIPVNKIAKWAEVNGTTYYLQTSNNLTEFNIFTQTGANVTFNTPLSIGEYLIIFYQ